MWVEGGSREFVYRGSPRSSNHLSVATILAGLSSGESMLKYGMIKVR